MGGWWGVRRGEPWFKMWVCVGVAPSCARGQAERANDKTAPICRPAARACSLTQHASVTTHDNQLTFSHLGQDFVCVKGSGVGAVSDDRPGQHCVSACPQTNARLSFPATLLPTTTLTARRQVFTQLVHKVAVLWEGGVVCVCVSLCFSASSMRGQHAPLGPAPPRLGRPSTGPRHPPAAAAIPLSPYTRVRGQTSGRFVLLSPPHTLSSARSGGDGRSGTTNADVDVGAGMPARLGWAGSGRSSRRGRLASGTPPADGPRLAEGSPVAPAIREGPVGVCRRGCLSLWGEGPQPQGLGVRAERGRGGAEGANTRNDSPLW